MVTQPKNTSVRKNFSQSNNVHGVMRCFVATREPIPLL